MKKLISLIEKSIAFIENAPINFSYLLVSLFSIIAIRIFIENWIATLQNRTGSFLFYEISHTFLFFLISFISFLAIIKIILKVDFKKAANVVLLGFLVILTPPIIDYILSGGKGFWSFYKFDGIIGLIQRFFTFFGDKPEIGVTYGVRIDIIISLIFLGFYAYFKSRKISKIFITLVVSYFILFILGTFPSYIAIAIEGFSKGFLNITDINVAKMFLSPAMLFSKEIPDIVSSLNIKMSLVYVPIFSILIFSGLYFYAQNKFIALIKNIRLPQIIYHIGLFSLGMALSFISFQNSLFPLYSTFNLDDIFFHVLGYLILLESISCAWIASVIINDITDKNIDTETNPSRPLVQNIFSVRDYLLIGILFFGASLFFSAIVNFKITLLLIVYQAIAWIYSAWPLRLKRFAFVSTFVGSIASLIIVFAGYMLISPMQNIDHFPFSIIILLVIGYTLSLPIKDFKDISGDKKDGVYTIPVLFGENIAKIIIGSGIFISFILSTIILNEKQLLLWAMLFGGISFWLIVKMKKDRKNSLINYRNIFWWMLAVVFIYLIILAKVIFF